MNRFLIYLIDGFVTVYGFDDDQTITLKYEGEERFPYSSEFWEWFKRKIDYNDEELSFLVVSDIEFKIPENIRIARKSSFNGLPCLKKYDKSKIYMFPEIEQSKFKEIVKKTRKKGLVDFFVEKTTNFKACSIQKQSGPPLGTD